MANRAAAYLLGFLILWGALRLIRFTKLRQVVLLVASYAFYATWGVWFLGVLIASSLANFFLGMYVRKRPSAPRLWVGILFNVAFLATFKYLPPLANSVFSQVPMFSFFRTIVLPLGISFWTFAALSYLFELYREEDLDPSLLEFCLFLAFWLMVFAGPICRLSEMLPQFRSDRRPSMKDLGAGLRRILTGVAMMALARLVEQGFTAGAGVDAGFGRTFTAWSAMDVWFLAFGYGFQLFFDFAGYSHLVIGAAQALGFQLPENFATPYLSLSPSVFWTRWHMSLSFWIRDNLFLPLVMLRREVAWRQFTLFLSMVIFGLWHKASWPFLVWGAYHGILLILHRQWQMMRIRNNFALPEFIETSVAWAFTFGAVCLGWILFRCPNVGQALHMLKVVISPRAYSFHRLPKGLYLLVAVAAIGYFSVVVIARLLTYLGERLAQRAATSGGTLGWNLLQQDRWVWVTPIAVVVSLYVFLILRPEQTTASPMLYRLF